VAYQTAARVLAAVRKETTPYSIATATGASVLRLIDSPGLTLNRAVVQSAEKRADAITDMPRLGYKSTQGSFNCEWSVGGANDVLLEGLVRNAPTSAVNIAFASVTTVAIGTNALTCGASSSWLTAGVRVGDVFVLSGTSVSNNNGVNAQVISVSTNTIITATGVFTTLAASSTGTLTILKKWVTGTTPTTPTFSIEQYDQDIDLSEVFIGNVLVGARFSFRPGQMAQVQWSFMGTDRTVLQTGTSPYFSAPTLSTSKPLVADDSSIRYNGAVVSTFTGLELDFQIAVRGEPTIGSLVTPTLFDNNLTATGTITGLRSDFANLALYDNETEFDLFMLLREPSGSPPNAFGFYLPRVKITNLSAPFGGGDGGKIETLAIALAPKPTTSGYNASLANFYSSGS
jgi:hypothetical protein